MTAKNIFVHTQILPYIELVPKVTLFNDFISLLG